MQTQTSGLPQNPVQEKRLPIKRLITFFLLLTGLGLGLIIYQAGGLTFLLFAINKLIESPIFIVAIIFLLCMEWLSDYFRYQVLAKHLKIPMPFGFGLKIVFANLFFAYLTPGGTFGAPVIIYMMYKKGVQLSHAIALALIKPFLTFFVMLASGGIVFFFSDFSFAPATQRILALSSAVVLMLTMLVAMLIFFPAPARRFTDQLFGLLRNLRNKKGATETPRLDKSQKGFHATIQAFALYGKSGWRGIFEGIITTVINLFLFVTISFTLLKALGFKAPNSTLWLYSYIYYFLIAFAPTPGASGLAEGGGYLFFKSIGTPQLVSSYVVLWRFVSCYLVMIIGAFLFLRFVRQAHLGEVEQFQMLDQLSHTGTTDLEKTPDPDELLTQEPPPDNALSTEKDDTPQLHPPTTEKSKISVSLPPSERLRKAYQNRRENPSLRSHSGRG